MRGTVAKRFKNDEPHQAGWDDLLLGAMNAEDAPPRQLEAQNSHARLRECRHIHRHSRKSGNPKAIGSKCVFASYRILDSRFRGNDGNRRLETDILKLTTPPRG